MKITKVSNSIEQNDEAIRTILAGRTIIRSGVALFEPRTVAHEGEKHVHEYDEIFIILDNEILVPIVGGESGVARVGDWVFVEKGEEHHLTNVTESPCTAIYMLIK